MSELAVSPNESAQRVILTPGAVILPMATPWLGLPHGVHCKRAMLPYKLDCGRPHGCSA